MAVAALGKNIPFFRHPQLFAQYREEALSALSRFDNLRAAILNVRLRHFPVEIARRRALARRYREGLDGVPELSLPPGPEGDPDHCDVYQNCEIEAERRDDPRHLERDGVRTIVQWAGTPVHGFGLPDTRVTDLPRTELLFRRVSSRP
jgi:dTDP-4-amino-4,6-dideoxygalactose transaminase